MLAPVIKSEPEYEVVVSAHSRTGALSYASPNNRLLPGPSNFDPLPIAQVAIREPHRSAIDRKHACANPHGFGAACAFCRRPPARNVEEVSRRLFRCQVRGPD